MIIVFYKETINTSAIDYLLLQGEIHIDVAAMLKQKVMMVMMPPEGVFHTLPVTSYHEHSTLTVRQKLAH